MSSWCISDNRCRPISFVSPSTNISARVFQNLNTTDISRVKRLRMTEGLNHGRSQLFFRSQIKLNQKLTFFKGEKKLSEYFQLLVRHERHGKIKKQTDVYAHTHTHKRKVSFFFFRPGKLWDGKPLRPTVSRLFFLSRSLKYLCTILFKLRRV